MAVSTFLRHSDCLPCTRMEIRADARLFAHVSLWLFWNCSLYLGSISMYFWMPKSEFLMDLYSMRVKSIVEMSVYQGILSCFWKT